MIWTAPLNRSTTEGEITHLDRGATNRVERSTRVSDSVRWPGYREKTSSHALAVVNDLGKIGRHAFTPVTAGWSRGWTGVSQSLSSRTYRNRKRTNDTLTPQPAHRPQAV